MIAAHLMPGIRQARQVANQQRLLADAALRTAIQNAMTAYQQLTSSRAQLVSLEAAIKANNIALQGTKRKQELGNMTVLDVLNAEQTLLNSKVQPRANPPQCLGRLLSIDAGDRSSLCQGN